MKIVIFQEKKSVPSFYTLCDAQEFPEECREG
jgi:hypothetical protein